MMLLKMKCIVEWVGCINHPQLMLDIASLGLYYFGGPIFSEVIGSGGYCIAVCVHCPPHFNFETCGCCRSIFSFSHF